MLFTANDTKRKKEKRDNVNLTEQITTSSKRKQRGRESKIYHVFLYPYLWGKKKINIPIYRDCYDRYKAVILPRKKSSFNMQHIKRFSITIYLSIISLFVFAQTPQLSGTVHNLQTGEPIPNVTIRVGHATTQTNSKGHYQFKTINKHITRIVATHIAYIPQSKKINLKDDAISQIDFKLVETDNPLNEVVVTGTRTKKTLGNTPVLTKVISDKEIEQIGATTALDALQSILPGLQFSPDGHGANMSIQGLDNDYVLILVDGERLVGETRGNVNFNRITATDIQRIEIVSGASSALYGSNAIGGVINIITKAIKKPFQGEIKSRYSNFNTLNNTLNVGIKKNRLTLKVNGFTHSSDGYDLTPETPETFTANPYKDLSVGTKIGFKATKKWHINLHGNIFRHESLNPPETLYKTHRRDINTTIGGKTSYAFGKDHTISISANTDDYTAKTVYEKINDSTSRTANYVYSTVLLTDYLTINDRWQLVSGLETNFEKIFSEILFGDTHQIKHAHDLNLFSQADWKPTDRLEIIGGFRYTNHSTFDNHFTPKISAMYRWNNFKWRGTAALGYKSPSLKELYYNFDHRGMFWIYGNKDLQPENSTYYALSTEYTKGTLNLSVNLYHNNIENKIDMFRLINNQTGKLELRHNNIAAAQLQGIESYLNWQFLSHFKLRIGYAYTDAKDKTTGLKLYGISQHTATTGLTFQTEHIRHPFAITLSGRVASPRLYQRLTTDKNNKEIIQKLSSIPISIWKIAYSQKITLYDQLSANLQVGVDNLLNFSEIKNSAEINPGRTYWVSLSLKY